VEENAEEVETEKIDIVETDDDDDDDDDDEDLDDLEFDELAEHFGEQTVVPYEKVSIGELRPPMSEPTQTEDVYRRCDPESRKGAGAFRRRGIRRTDETNTEGA